MIHLVLESIATVRRGVEISVSRSDLRFVANIKLPKLWCLSLDLRRIRKPEWVEQEKSGLHVSPVDNDGWNSIYYRRPGSRYYGVLMFGRRESWFEKTATRGEHRSHA